jgi:hypothetical protein
MKSGRGRRGNQEQKPAPRFEFLVSTLQEATKETRNRQLRFLGLLLLSLPSSVGAGQAEAVEAVCHQESQVLLADVQPRIPRLARMLGLWLELCGQQVGLSFDIPSRVATSTPLVLLKELNDRGQVVHCGEPIGRRGERLCLAGYCQTMIGFSRHEHAQMKPS